MAQKRLLKKFDAAPEVIEGIISEALGDTPEETLSQLYEDSIKNFTPDSILKGKVVRVLNNEVLVDIGYKSEGVVFIQEFGNPDSIQVGEELEVLLETIEDESGLMILSKRKADRIRGWEKVIATFKEGDTVTGKAIRKIKGGLLVDIGVPVFLPASQVSIRRSKDIAEYIDKDLECKIIKIDEARMNIVVSRRRLVEERRALQRETILADLEEGQIRDGVVKNIADFGAFVDLGGIDGLLHITDMSWGRVSHPSDMLKIDEEIQVMVLKFDKERGRIALGLKQKSQSPWLSVHDKYPVGKKVVGEVVNIMPYGAFVKLEEGIEGLVHISEMSWTRRINHPSEVVALNDNVEVVVLDINTDKQEISLGMKQAEANPWDQVEQRYPSGTIIEGLVRNITSYGAFIELEEGIDGLLHVSDVSWTKKVNHPNEVLKKGERVKAVVLTVEPDKKRIALGIKQLQSDPWIEEIPEKFHTSDLVSGVVTKITNFGVFVELEDGLEGLLHISEISDRKIHRPEEIVDVDNKVNVRILKVDTVERKIGLSMIDVEQPEIVAVTPPPEAAEEAAQPDAATESATAEPDAAESVAAEPDAAESVAAEPATAEPVATETAAAEPAETVEPAPDAEPAAAEPEAEVSAEPAEPAAGTEDVPAEVPAEEVTSEDKEKPEEPSGE
jgi:small subunit ribosomal protein S1